MKKVIAAGVLALIFSVFVSAQLIVHDPINYENALVMLSELIVSYEQLKAQFDLMTWNSKTIPVNMASRYRSLQAAWYGLQAQNDQFGNVSGWLQSVNRGGSGWGAYNGASVPIGQYGALSQLAPDEQKRVAAQYAGAQITDGTNVQTMETVGSLRANAAAVDRSISSLESDSLSLDPTLNTEIGVLNKINAASMVALRSGRDTNRALLSALEQQLADSKMRRDAEASDINTQIARIERGATTKAQYTSTITQTIQSFRWK